MAFELHVLQALFVQGMLTVLGVVLCVQELSLEVSVLILEVANRPLTLLNVSLQLFNV